MTAKPDPTIEALAALAHEQWAHWTGHMLDVLDVDNISLTTEARRAVERWRRHIKTHYDHLSEDEKESDREWARKWLIREWAHKSEPAQSSDFRVRAAEARYFDSRKSYESALAEYERARAEYVSALYARALQFEPPSILARARILADFIGVPDEIVEGVEARARLSLLPEPPAAIEDPELRARNELSTPPMAIRSEAEFRADFSLITGSPTDVEGE